MLPKTSTYVKSCDRQDKWIYFLTESDELLENIVLFETQCWYQKII